MAGVASVVLREDLKKRGGDGDPQIPKSIWWLPIIDVIGFGVARSVE
jgi:hypothetical protein